MGIVPSQKGAKRMIFIGKYDELSPGMSYPKMKDSFSEKPYSTKADILAYLRSGHAHMATAARVVDVFSGNQTFLTLVHYNDGEYSWTSKLIYYIEKYNLRLPEDLETSILNKSRIRH